MGLLIFSRKWIISGFLFLTFILGIGCGAVDEPSLSDADLKVPATKAPKDRQELKNKMPVFIVEPVKNAKGEHIAEGYHFLVSSDPDFQDIIKDSTYVQYETYEKDGIENISAIKYFPRIYLAAGTYYWKARARYDKGYGLYSETRMVQVNTDIIIFSWPIITKIGPLTIGTYGPMMALGFLAGLFLLINLHRRRGYSEELAYNIVFAAIIGGVIGAKGLSLVENWQNTIKHPLDSIFSGSGLTWYGGFIGGAITSMIVIYRSKEPFWGVVDVVSPMLALGYSFGRMGCQLSADGCFGEPSFSGWGFAYPDDFVGTPDILYQTLHPTPIYEIALNVPIFFILWFMIRKFKLPHGVIFSIYLILTAIPRYFVEFIRLNKMIIGPDIGLRYFEITDFSIFNLTISQFISVLMFFGGIGLMFFFLKRKNAKQVT